MKKLLFSAAALLVLASCGPKTETTTTNTPATDPNAAPMNAPSPKKPSANDGGASNNTTTSADTSHTAQPNAAQAERERRLASLKVTLGGLEAGEVPAAEFKKATSLAVKGTDTPPVAVLEFTMHYTAKGKDPIELMGAGAMLTGQPAKAIGMAKKGDTFEFIRVKIKFEDSPVPHTLENIKFTIK